MKTILKSVLTLGILSISQAVSAVELRAKIDSSFAQQYEFKIDIQGQLNLKQDKQTKSVPLKLAGELAFSERRIDDGSTPTEIRAVRYYDKAKSTIRMDKDNITTQLSSDRALVRAGVSNQKLTLNAIKSPITRDERDLLEIVSDPLAMIGVLPKGEAEPNDTWDIPKSTLKLLFGLDEVKQSKVSAKLLKVKGDHALFTIKGDLEGKIYGAKTLIDVDGAAEFDSKTGQFAGWKLTVKENRSANFVGPGLEITAKIDATATQANEPAELTDVALQGIKLVDEKQTDNLLYVQRRSAFAMQYDSRWRIVLDESQLMSMRLVDDGDILAQVNFRLAQLPGSAPPTKLNEFESQVQHSIGKNFSKIQSSNEGANPNGFRTLKIVAEGEVDNIPIIWISYLFEGPESWRLNVTYSLEDKFLGDFGDADRAILETVMFPGEKSITLSDESKRR